MPRAGNALPALLALLVLPVGTSACRTRWTWGARTTGCASSAVQFHPDGGQPDFARSSARAEGPHGGASHRTCGWANAIKKNARVNELFPPLRVVRRPRTTPTPPTCAGPTASARQRQTKKRASPGSCLGSVNPSTVAHHAPPPPPAPRNRQHTGQQRQMSIRNRIDRLSTNTERNKKIEHTNSSSNAF